MAHLAPKKDHIFSMEEVLDQFYALFEDAALDVAANYQAAEGSVDLEGGIKEQAKGVANDNYSRRINDYDIAPIVYTVRYEKPQRGHDFISLGKMPHIYRKMFDLSGKVYVSRAHLYCCMVSKETAIKEGRYQSENSDDYHELPEEKLINAIEQIQDPLVIMESLNDFKEPRLVMILDEKGNDKQNLIAVMELYAEKTSSETNQRRNHVLITIYEKRDLADYVGKTAKSKRVLYINEKAPAETVANLQLVGTVSTDTLNNNIRNFNKKVKAFKEKNKINYQRKHSHNIVPGRNDVVAELLRLKYIKKIAMNKKDWISFWKSNLFYLKCIGIFWLSFSISSLPQAGVSARGKGRESSSYLWAQIFRKGKSCNFCRFGNCIAIFKISSISPSVNPGTTTWRIQRGISLFAVSSKKESTASKEPPVYWR